MRDENLEWANANASRLAVVHENYSPNVQPFNPGDVIKDHRGKTFGVYEIDVVDGSMSRYTCLCFDDGAAYSNLPHYTMTLVETYESICAKNMLKSSGA